MGEKATVKSGKESCDEKENELRETVREGYQKVDVEYLAKKSSRSTRRIPMHPLRDELSTS
jgi:hypothetical protein